MPTPNNSDSNYTDQEIADILKRATELQASAEKTADLRPGLTLKELEQVAAEVGLDPRFVRTAAAERSGKGTASFRRASEKNDTHIFAERHLLGAFTEQSWEDTVLELRHRFDTALGASMGSPHGRSRTESFGRAREWQHMSVSGVETRIMIRPREDSVDIRLSQRVGLGSPTTEATLYGLAAAMLIGLVGGAWGGMAVGWATFVLAWIAAFPLIRHLDLAWRGKKHRQLEELADTVARLAVVAPAPTSTSIHSAVQEQQADGPALTLPEDEAVEAAQVRRRVSTR